MRNFGTCHVGRCADLATHLDVPPPDGVEPVAVVPMCDWHRQIFAQRAREARS